MKSSNPTPKSEFMLDAGAVKAHRALIERPEFEVAIRTAQLHYQRVMCGLAPTSLDSPNQLQGSAMCFQRIQGMNDFISTLLKLADMPVLVPRKDMDNLKQ